MTNKSNNDIIKLQKGEIKMEKTRKISDLITELYEIQKEYGDIEYYDIEFYVENNGEKNILTI